MQSRLRLIEENREMVYLCTASRHLFINTYFLPCCTASPTQFWVSCVLIPCFLRVSKQHRNPKIKKKGCFAGQSTLQGSNLFLPLFAVSIDQRKYNDWLVPGHRYAIHGH